MIAVSLSLTAYFNEDEVPTIFLDEEVLSETIQENLTASLERIDVEEVVFTKIDISGLM
jgi:hypothetical protein